LGTVCAESSELYGVDGYDDSEFIWSVEGGSITDGDGEDTITIEWGYRIGRYLLEVQEVTIGGCPGVPSTGYVTVQAPEVELGAYYQQICDGDSLVFDARGGYDDPYTMQWQDGTFAPTYTAKETGLIWVLVTDALGCTRYDSVDFTKNLLPFVSLGNDTILCDEENPYEIDGGNFSAYDWKTSTGESYTGNPFYAYPMKGITDTIMLTVTDENSCENSDTLVILPCNVLELFKNIPNTFTPNNDGVNEVWNIPYMDQFPKAVLEIFDRWGRLVYRTEDVQNEPWDGTSKGREMPMDSYFYVIDLKYLNFETISGSVNLIR
jgi:gliding motility-associated-like protein